ncbi:hypothetical protein RSAG8_06460, partial [Rhizoctonia solani AG-8 WAC10335]
MPTYAGYMMTRQHQIEFLRLRHPEIQVTEEHVPSAKPIYDIIHKRKLLDIISTHPVVLPGLPDVIWDKEKLEMNPNHMALMFVRRVVNNGPPVWLPPREIPGVASDRIAKKILEKCGFVISDWVVIHMPADDVLLSQYVTDPNHAQLWRRVNTPYGPHSTLLNADVVIQRRIRVSCLTLASLCNWNDHYGR